MFAYKETFVLLCTQYMEEIYVSYYRISVFLHNRTVSKNTETSMSRETYMIESLTRDLVTRLMEERKLTMRQALDVVYRSNTYKALSNPETGLYFQSAVYLYDELEEELEKIQHIRR